MRAVADTVKKSLRARFARIFCAALLLVAPAASIAEEASLPPAHPALWRVQHGTSTLYLFGSLHILPSEFAWRTPEIDAAMSASDLFIFEVPVDDAALKDEKEFIIQNGILPQRRTLRGMLSSNEFQTYSAVLRRAGLRPEQFERYRPWLAAVVLGLAYLHRQDLTTLKGADDQIMDYARQHGRKLLYLESMREQMELLTSGDEAGHLRALKSLIVALPRSRTQERDLVEAWSSGDTKRFNGLLQGYFEGRSEAKDWLIDRRNRNWLPAIRQLLDRPNGTTMITVGAAHIGGAMGLIALLCREGYQIERVDNAHVPGEKACAPES
jgi:uncharacterized protein YbaP (TraB family)